MKPFIYSFLLIFFSLNVVNVFAQEDPEEMMDQRLQALKIGLITEKLNLSESQAQKFWPIYNAYNDEKKAIRKELKKMRKSKDTLTDNELKLALEKGITLMQKELDLEKKYMTEFLKVINIRQLAELQEAEHHFKRMLLDQLREGKGGGMHHRDKGDQ